MKDFNRHNLRLIKRQKLGIMVMLWLAIGWSGSTFAEECIIDDGFIDDTADGFDTNGGATSDMTASVACGQSATAGGPGATAIGFEANATANSVAVGDRAKATENKTAAFGAIANASKPNATTAKEAEFRSGGDLKIGGSVIEGSSRTIKKNIVEVDPNDILAKLDNLPIHRWTYKHNPDRIRHMGPMAEDFYALFNLGETDKGISGLDTSGVALAAIKALNSNLVSELSQKDRQIDELKQEKDKEIATLKADLAAVKTQLAEVADFKELLTRYIELDRTANHSQVSF